MIFNGGGKMENKSKNVHWHNQKVSKQDRNGLNKQKSKVIWFTGLSGSGKSTIACELEKKLHNEGVRTYLLDGDNIRHGLNSDLEFSEKDRKENIRRIKEVSKLFVDAGIVTIASFISPFRADRDAIRNAFESDEFIEIFIDCPLDVCEHRDPKGLYKKARFGIISNFTGIDSPYEHPIRPEIVIKSNQLSIDEATNRILDFLMESPGGATE